MAKTPPPSPPWKRGDTGTTVWRRPNVATRSREWNSGPAEAANHVAAIATRFGIDVLYAFGSRAREATYQLYVLRRAGDLAPFERARRAHLLATTR